MSKIVINRYVDGDNIVYQVTTKPEYLAEEYLRKLFTVGDDVPKGSVCALKLTFVDVSLRLHINKKFEDYLLGRCPRLEDLSSDRWAETKNWFADFYKHAISNFDEVIFNDIKKSEAIIHRKNTPVKSGIMPVHIMPVH